MIIGIDTGATGAVAIGTRVDDVDVFDLLPVDRRFAGASRGCNVVDVDALASELRARLGGSVSGDVAFVEQPLAFAAGGTSSVLQRGRTLGRIEATLELLRVRVVFVPPSAWHEHHGIRVRSGAHGEDRLAYKTGKDQVLYAAAALFPHLELWPAGRKRSAPYYDRADAAMIWAYGAGVACPR